MRREHRAISGAVRLSWLCGANRTVPQRCVVVEVGPEVVGRNLLSTDRVDAQVVSQGKEY